MKYNILAAIIIKAQPLIIAPIVIYILGRADYSIIDYVTYLSNLIGVFVILGINNGFARYIHENDDESIEDKKNRFYIMSVALAISMFSVICLIDIINSNAITNLLPSVLVNHKRVMSGYILSGIINYIIMTGERFCGSGKKVFLISLFNLIIPVLLLITIHNTGEEINFSNYLEYCTLGYIITSIVFVFQARKSLKFRKILTECQKYIKYSIPFLIVLICEGIIQFVPRFILEKISHSELATFALASRISSLILAFNFVISFVMTPIYYKNKESRQFESFWNLIFGIAGSILVIILIAFPYILDLFGNIWGKVKFDNTTHKIIVLTMAANIISGLQLFHVGVVFTKKIYNISLIYLVCVLLCAILTNYLSHRFNAEGAAYSVFFISLVVFYSYIRIDPGYKKLVRTSNILVGTIMIIVFIQNMKYNNRLIISISIIIIILYYIFRKMKNIQFNIKDIKIEK